MHLNKILFKPNVKVKERYLKPGIPGVSLVLTRQFPARELFPLTNLESIFNVARFFFLFFFSMDNQNHAYTLHCYEMLR